jgi:hypothetical protein
MLEKVHKICIVPSYPKGWDRHTVMCSTKKEWLFSCRNINVARDLLKALGFERVEPEWGETWLRPGAVNERFHNATFEGEPSA